MASWIPQQELWYTRDIEGMSICLLYFVWNALDLTAEELRGFQKCIADAHMRASWAILVLSALPVRYLLVQPCGHMMGPAELIVTDRGGVLCIFSICKNVSMLLCKPSVHGHSQFRRTRRLFSPNPACFPTLQHCISQRLSM